MGQSSYLKIQNDTPNLNHSSLPTRNSQLPTRNSKLATRNLQLATTLNPPKAHLTTTSPPIAHHLKNPFSSTKAEDFGKFRKV